MDFLGRQAARPPAAGWGLAQFVYDPDWITGEDSYDPYWVTYEIATGWMLNALAAPDSFKT